MVNWLGQKCSFLTLGIPPPCLRIETSARTPCKSARGGWTRSRRRPQRRGGAGGPGSDRSRRCPEQSRLVALPYTGQKYARQYTGGEVWTCKMSPIFTGATVISLNCGVLTSWPRTNTTVLFRVFIETQFSDLLFWFGGMKKGSLRQVNRKRRLTRLIVKGLTYEKRMKFGKSDDIKGWSSWEYKLY